MYMPLASGFGTHSCQGHPFGKLQKAIVGRLNVNV